MQVSHTFPQDIHTVYQTLTDPEFLKQRAIALGSVNASCESDANDHDCKLTLVRERKINVPGVLSAFVKSVQIATTEEHWSLNGDQYECSNTTEIDGAPLSIIGTMALTPNASGCTFSANFETKAHIMFGKKNLQQYAAKTIAKELELECEYTAKHLGSASA